MTSSAKNIDFRNPKIRNPTLGGDCFSNELWDFVCFLSVFVEVHFFNAFQLTFGGQRTQKLRILGVVRCA